jgi:hypothetical protein
MDGTGKAEDTDGWFNCLNEPGKQLPQVRQDFVGYSAIVGRKASTARYYLEDVDETWELLRSLNQAGQRATQNQSTPDLRYLDRPEALVRERPDGAGLPSFGRPRAGSDAMGRGLAGTMRRAGGMGGYRTSVGDLASLTEGQ